MKKIITSMAAVAALSTVAFAATTLTYSDAPTTGFTYNEKRIAVVAYDANLTNATDLDGNTVTDTGIIYTPSVKLAVSNFVTVKLTGGAKFLGAATDWVLKDAGGTEYATTINASATMTELEFQVATEIPASTTLYLASKAVAGGDHLSSQIQLPKGTTGDVTLEFSARSDGGSVLGLAAASTVIFTGENDKEPSATLQCNEAKINSETLSSFVPATTDNPATTQNTVSCYFNLTAYTPSNIDFDLSDTNITLITTGAAFSDGNVTDVDGYFSDDTSNGSTGMTFSNTGASLATATNKEIKFTLTNTTDKIDTNQVDAKVTVGYNSAVLTTGVAATGISHTTTLLDTSKAMSYILSTYKANILNLRSNAANGTETYIAIYNNSDADTTVKATVTNPDSTEFVLDNIATIKANSSKNISFGSLVALNDSLLNGAQVDITMPIDALKGDVVAFQNQPAGRIGLRVVDNNGKTKGN